MAEEFIVFRFGKARNENGENSCFSSKEKAEADSFDEAVKMLRENKDNWPDLEMEQDKNCISVYSESDSFYAAWYICKVPTTQIEELKMLVELARVGLYEYVYLLEDPYSCEEYLDKIEDILNKMV